MRTQNEGNFEESYNFSSARKRLLRTETRCNSIIDTGAAIRMAQACEIFSNYGEQPIEYFTTCSGHAPGRTGITK